MGGDLVQFNTHSFDVGGYNVSLLSCYSVCDFCRIQEQDDSSGKAVLVDCGDNENEARSRRIMQKEMVHNMGYHKSMGKREKEDRPTLYCGDCSDLLAEMTPESVDLVITSPPYCMGKAYEKRSDDVDTFLSMHRRIIPLVANILKPGGSMCWQVGYHVVNSEILPLDFLVYQVVQEINAHLSSDMRLVLRNRIIWTFGHGLNSRSRFSGRHETILWFTKGSDYNFNLDAVRVPQKYPGKRSYKGPKKGELSGNPLGKNPSDVWEVSTDVWDIPNVKARHVEKTEHPCQFPVAIPRRLIRALTQKNDVVLDPFMGVGTTGIAAVLEGRRFVGAELDTRYFELAGARINLASQGKLRIREDKPVQCPDSRSKVATLPDSFDQARRGFKDENRH